MRSEDCEIKGKGSPGAEEPAASASPPPPVSTGSGTDLAEDLRVSLVATVLNEAETLSEWWRSILSQTRLPDEAVVVDGGSRDGTAERLRELAAEAPFPVRVEVLPGSNIARGRNHAISLASHPVIAVTDAGCVLDQRWLENLVVPFREDPEVRLVAGFYLPLARSWFEAVSACVTLPLPDEVREDRFLPSSRSLAFRREVWEKAGGYPEWLNIGEDMYFNHRWKELGIKHRLRRDAVALWRMRPDLPSLLRQYFRYARGDGESGMYPHRHLLRFFVYGGLVFFTFSPRRRRYLPVTLPFAAAYAGKRWKRVPVYLAGRPAAEKAAAVVTIPLLLAAVDAAKMVGYLHGLWKRGTGEAGGGRGKSKRQSDRRRK